MILVSLIITVIDPTKRAGRVYTDIGFFVLIISLFAFVAMKYVKELPIAFVGISVNKKEQNMMLLMSVAAGFALSLLLVGSQLFGIQSFLSPLSIPSLSFISTGAIAVIFMGSIYVSEIEETLRSSTLLPMLMNYLEQVPIWLSLFVMGLIVYFIIALQTFGIVLMIAAGLTVLLSKTMQKSLKSTYFVGIVSVAVAGIIFASFHYYAYQASEGMLVSAFIFAVIADTINIALGNTIASRIAHTTNNATLALAATGLPGLFALVIAGAHALWLVACNKAKLTPV